MAALMRMSKVVSSSSIRSVFRAGLTKTCAVSLTKNSHVHDWHSSIAAPSYLTRSLSISVSESLLRDGAQNERQGRDRTIGGQHRDGRPRVDYTVDNRIQNLDNHIRRMGRIDRGQLFSVLTLAKKQGSVSEQHALTLIRGCGAVLVKESPESRQKILNDVVSQIQPLVANFDISHHNAVLRIRLENKEKIDPAQVLSEIEENLKLFPNRITYQLLIAAYCEEGDLEGASKILTHMKNQDIPVNEAVFHALIRGHMKRGDTAGAKDILSSMKSAGLLPIAESYTALMCGYAENGDIGSVVQTLSEVDSEEVTLQSRNLFAVVVDLVENGHSHMMPQVLSEVKERFAHRPPFNHEALNCAHRLIVLGKDAEAMEVFKSITDFPGPEYKEFLAKLFLEGFAVQNRDAGSLIKMMDELTDMGYLTISHLQHLATVLTKARYTDTALNLYKEMINRGEEVQRLTVQPLYRSKLQDGDPDGLCAFAAQVRALLKWDKNTVFDTIFQVVQPLQRKGLSLDEVYTKLMEHGLKDSDITELKLFEHIGQGQFSDAKELVSQGCVPGMAAMPIFLSKGYQETQDLSGLLEFLDILHNLVASQVYFKQITTSTLTKIIEKDKVGPEEAESLINKFMKKNLILIQGSGQQGLVNIMRTKMMEPGKLVELEESFRNMTIPTQTQPFNKKSLENLASILENSPGSVPMQLRNKAELRLLLQYCREGDVDKADQLKTSMDERGFQFHGEIQRALAVYYAKHKKDLTTALKYKEGLQVEEKTTSARCNLAIANLYAEQGDLSKAFAEINESNHKSADYKYQLVDDCVKLLELCSQQGGLSMVRDMSMALFDHGFLAEGTNQLLSVVMREHLKSGDGDEIVSYTEQMTTMHNKVSSQRELLSFFIEREDAERLQKVVDLMCTVYGEMDVLHQLTFAFVECGKIRQAKKILETPGLRAKMPIFDKELTKYFIGNKVDLMEQIVDITKGLFGINRDDMLFWIMRMYSKLGEPKKALGVLSNYEEEGTMPRPRTLRYLAKVLESAEMPVPFTVPKVPEKREVTQTSMEDMSQTEQAFLDLLTAEEVEEAMALRNKAMSENEALSDNLLNRGILMLYKNRQINTCRKVLLKISDTGDVDSLLKMRRKLPVRLEGTVHKCLFRAHINSGRAEEFLDSFNADSNMFSAYLDIENFELVKKAKPELFQKLLDLVMQSVDTNPDNLAPAHVLFCYYMLNDQSSQAMQLLERFPDMKGSIRTSPMSTVAAMRNMENIFPTLVELAPDGQSFKVYNRWLNLTCTNENAEKAMSIYESAKSKGMELHHFSTTTLMNYKSTLDKAGIPLPWMSDELETVLRKKEEQAGMRRRGRDGAPDEAESPSASA